jgi:uncharacterized SAM-binding protein YcdF (DUF218 family)
MRTVLIVILLVLALGWTLAWAAARALVVEVKLQHADVILVMAGAPVYFGRTAEAGRLFLDGRADKILLTNDGVRGSWSRTLQRNPFYYERAMLRLTQAGVPVTSVELLSGRISSTFDEAALMSAYARTHAVKSVIVVTSEYHTRRALWTVRRVLRDTGVEVGVQPATPIFDSVSPHNWWWYARGWQMVFGEYVKLAYYRFHY